MTSCGFFYKWRFAAAVVFLSSMPAVVRAQTITIGSSADFANAITTIDSNPSTDYTLSFTGNVTLSQTVGIISTSANITVAGNGFTLSGNNTYRPFFVENGNVALQNLSIVNGMGHGGNGGSAVAGGGGGLGAGGAVFVDTNGHVTLSNVAFSNNAAVGGNGGASTTGITSGAGGGGFFGSGGNSANAGGGGGGGLTASGSDAPSSGNGGAGAGGTAGGVGLGNPGSAGTFGNGGGGGALRGNGGAGGAFGGGGGSGFLTGTGGAGGFGGGGGGGYNAGGNGGFGGGHGGSETIGGNGGSAYGGALFVRQGGTVTIDTSATFTGDSVTAGTGVSNGSTDGADLYLMRGTTTSFNIGSGQTYTFSQVLGNNDGTANPGSAIVKTGSGTLVLTGNSTYSGTTYVQAGTLQVNGSIGAFATVSASSTLSGTSTTLNETITSSGHVLLTETGSSSYAINHVHGGGDFIKAGAGTLTLSGTAFYTGGTNVAAGTLVGDTTSIQRTITNSGNVSFLQNSSGTYSGNMSGTGSVTVSTSGSMNFTGTNSYTGGTYLAAGTLQGNTDSLYGTITNTGNVVFNQITTGTFNGSITYVGGVVVNGPGTVIFDQTNSYTGGTAVNSGTLQGTTQGLQGNIVDNGTVAFSQNFNGTYSGDISGTGSLIFEGAGKVAMTGNVSLSGTTAVNSGIYSVNGTNHGDIDVGADGQLGGNGTIVGDVAMNGTLAPGNSIGYLTISGNVLDSSSSNYAVQIAPGGNTQGIHNDFTYVNGTATIAGTVAVDGATGTYNPGTKYTILTATGGVHGVYSSISDNLANYNFVLSYDADDVFMTLFSTSSNFATIAQTYNQFQVATALDTISSTATSDMATYISQLEGLSPAQQRDVLNQLSGDIIPSISAIEIQTTSTWIQLINNRIANQFQLASLAERSRQNFAVNAPSNGPDESEIYTVAYTQSSGAAGSEQPMMRFRRASGPKWTGWMQGYGLGGNVASNGNAGALSYGLGGSVFGVDRWMGRNTMVGVLGGYAGSNAGDSFASSSTAINGYQVGVYGLHRFERFYALGATAYSGDNYTTNRAINVVPALTAHSSYAGNQFVKYAEVGTMYQLGRTRVMPLMAVQYIYLDQQSFNETGAGVFNLSVGHQTTNSIRPMLGTRLYQEYFWHGLRVVPTAQGRWQRECGDGTHLITSSFSGAPTVAFNTAGNTLGRDFGLFSLGSNVILNSRTSLYGGYDLQVASRYTANMGSAGLQYRW